MKNIINNFTGKNSQVHHDATIQTNNSYHVDNQNKMYDALR